MRRHVFLAIIIIAIGVWALAMADDKCEYRVVVTDLVTWTDWYIPCGNTGHWDIAFEKIPDGSPSLWIIIQNQNMQNVVSKEIHQWQFDWGPGSYGEDFAFQKPTKHRAMVDYQPTIGEPGFAHPVLTINYYEGHPTGPQGE